MSEAGRPSRRLVPIAVAGALLLVGGAHAALAQGSVATPQPGEKLKDAKGVVMGSIEKVVTDASGAPRQVQVRIGGVLRTLPITGLTRVGDAYVTVLSRPELDALPAAGQP